MTQHAQDTETIEVCRDAAGSLELVADKLIYLNTLAGESDDLTDHIGAIQDAAVYIAGLADQAQERDLAGQAERDPRNATAAGVNDQDNGYDAAPEQVAADAEPEPAPATPAAKSKKA